MATPSQWMLRPVARMPSGRLPGCRSRPRAPRPRCPGRRCLGRRRAHCAARRPRRQTVRRRCHARRRALRSVRPLRRHRPSMGRSPGPGGVQVVGQERPRHHLVQEIRITGVDGAEEPTHELVGALRGGCGVEAVEAGAIRVGGAHRMTSPLLTVIVWPVSAAASSRASIATTAAVSSGVSGRDRA